MDAVEIVRANLKRLRESKDMSLRALAKKAGIDVSSYHRIETGGGGMTLPTLEKLAGGLGVPVVALLESDVADDQEIRHIYSQLSSDNQQALLLVAKGLLSLEDLGREGE